MAEALKNTIVQSLECPVCLNLFKDPKILSCSHTYCKVCLDNLIKCHGNEQVRCPVCRADTQVLNRDASLLQTNLALKSLIEDVENQHQVCTNCKSEEKPCAVVYCQDCGKYLCIPCQTMHSQWDAFSDHEVISMSDIASGKVSVRRFRKCRKHPREDEECFCTDCRKFACFRCVVIEHKDEGHRVIEASVYESNHLKSVEDLKSNVDKKLSCIQKYVDFIDEQKDLVSTEKKQCIDDISKVYEESARLLSEKKELLIDEVTCLTTDVNTELDKMKKEAQEQITHMKTTTDLVANGTKIPVDTDALAAHDTLCQELQKTLKIADPDIGQPRQSREKGIKGIVYKRNVGVDQLCLNKIMSFVSKKISLPKKNSMKCVVSTPDGRMAVGCHTGGIEIYSVDGQLQQTVLKYVSIREVGFLSDGRCVVRNTNNKITLHTAEWVNLNKKFATLNRDAAGWGGLDVDTDDHVYVGYNKLQVIHVFSGEGGKVIKEIPYGYEPWQVISFNDQLIIRNKDSTLSVVDKDGGVKHRATTRRNICAHATVTQDNKILIAWVNHGEGLVSIDEHNKELLHVKNLITDHKIEKPERQWYYLQEFRSGEIAFCTPDILHIFHRENVV